MEAGKYIAMSQGLLYWGGLFGFVFLKTNN